MTLTLVFAEAALELVPREIVNHPSIFAHAKRRGKKADEILLDVSYHHAAMRPFERFEKRGRPDIIHFSVLEALGSPLNKEGELETWIHTVKDEVIRVAARTRLPRNYDRFVSLMEQLLKERQVPPKGEALLQAEPLPLDQLVERIGPTKLIGLSTLGRPATLEEICGSLLKEKKPAIMLGGFAGGHFAERNAALCDEMFRMDREALDSWVVTSRTIYEYERVMKGFHKRRLISHIAKKRQ
jgi:rRNA small subunit pseudouridine methyltransferase Nep1